MRRPWRKRKHDLRRMETQADDLLSAAKDEAAKTRSETREVSRLARETSRIEAHNQIAEIIRDGLRGGA